MGSLSLFWRFAYVSFAIGSIGFVGSPALAQSAVPLEEAERLATRGAIAQPLLQGYRDTAGRFEIGLPPGYTLTPTPTGLVFTSADGNFGGLVDVGSAQGQWFSLTELETALKTEYEQRLSSITWQGAYEHAHGGMRIDWTGQDPVGNQLDAISFIQQQGDYIFVLSMWGVNTPYSTYNDDADAIFAAYHIQP